jgi:hypothetical protein
MAAGAMMRGRKEGGLMQIALLKCGSGVDLKISVVSQTNGAHLGSSDAKGFDGAVQAQSRNCGVRWKKWVN